MEEENDYRQEGKRLSWGLQIGSSLVRIIVQALNSSTFLLLASLYVVRGAILMLVIKYPKSSKPQLMNVSRDLVEISR